jgi:hypothetical protein
VRRGPRCRSSGRWPNSTARMPVPASRCSPPVQALADPVAYISRGAAEQVRDKVPIKIETRGEQTVKNIARPIEVFCIIAEDRDAFVVAIKKSETHVHTPMITDKPSIAVLAFNNMSGDSEQEYFSDGISEESIQLSWLWRSVQSPATGWTWLSMSPSAGFFGIAALRPVPALNPCHFRCAGLTGYDAIPLGRAVKLLDESRTVDLIAPGTVASHFDPMQCKPCPLQDLLNAVESASMKLPAAAGRVRGYAKATWRGGTSGRAALAAQSGR